MPNAVAPEPGYASTGMTLIADAAVMTGAARTGALYAWAAESNGEEV